MTELGLGPFKIIINRPDAIYLKPGETIIVSYWKWWPPGWKQKQYRMDEDGDASVTCL